MKTVRRVNVLALIVALLLPLLALPLAAWAKAPEAADVDKVKKVQDKHTEALLALPGVVGTATGLDGSGNPAVKVFLTQAGVAKIPAKLDEVDTVVEVTGEIVAQTDPTAWFPRPVPIGVSSGTERLTKVKGKLYCTVGTLGARVKDGNGVLYALSNNHVYALENKGVVGDLILQPGRVDMDPPCALNINNRIGTLQLFIPITFSRKATNTVDAALAMVDFDQTGASLVDNGTPSDGYGIPSSEIAEAVLDMPVQKYGRTTGLTYGTIKGVNVTILVKYDGGTARFVNQVQITGSEKLFSDSGDSGSLIVTRPDDDSPTKPVALLFAGGSNTTFGNPIGAVLTSLGQRLQSPVTIDGQ